METYLEALERLGKLRDAGVLTKEEFEAEKAHLLHARHTGEETEVPASKRRLAQYVVLSLIVAVLLGGGVSYLIFRNIWNSSAGSEAASPHSSEPVAVAAEQGLSITFADPSKCEPGPSLSDLLAKLRDAGTADEGSDLRLIRLAGSPQPAQIESSTQNFGQEQIHLTGLPVSSTWQGLRVTEIRTAEWDEGTGFQLRFQSSPETALRTLQEAGFPIKTIDKSVTNGGIFQAIEKSSGGALLTCMKSSKAGQSTEATDESDGMGD